MKVRNLLVRHQESLFLGLIVLFSAYILMLSLQWSSSARTFPVVGTILLIIFSILQILGNLRAGASRVRDGEGEGTAAGQDRSSGEPVYEFWELLRMLSWIVIFILLIYVFGFILGLSLGVVACMLYYREKARLAILIGLFSYAYLGFLKDALAMPWPPGIFGQFLPWM